MRLPDQPPRWETGASIDHLSERLHLPPNTQDWVFIVVEQTRISEFCDLYESNALDAETQFTLMNLIVGSLNDALADQTAGQDMTDRVERLLRKDFWLNFHTIYYWSLQEDREEEEDINNLFPITPLMRRIWQDCFQPEYQQWLDDDTLTHEE